jgi:hypothetical protein
MQQRQMMFGGFSKKCSVKYTNTTDTLGIHGTQIDAVGGSTTTAAGMPVNATPARKTFANEMLRAETALAFVLCWISFVIIECLFPRWHCLQRYN